MTVRHRHSFILKLLSLITISMVMDSTNLSAQTPVDMEWCLSEGRSIEGGGIEFRNGRIIGVNLAGIDTDAQKSNLLKLPDLEYLRLSNQALDSLGAPAITKYFANLNELDIRYLSSAKSEDVSVAFSEYRQLLTLPHLTSLTIELLKLSDNGAKPASLSESPIKQLDAAIYLKSSLSHLLDGLQLKQLRLQLLNKSRSLNADDLEVINKQNILESFSFVGGSNVSFVEPSDAAGPTKIDFSKLNGLSQLKELSLFNVDFDPAELKNFPQLKLLKIRECRFESSSFEVLFHHPSLEKVVVLASSNHDLGLSKPLQPVESKLKQIDLIMTPFSELDTFANVNCNLHVTFGNTNAKRNSERFNCAFDYVTRQLTKPELNQLIKLKKLSEVKFAKFSNVTTESAILRLASKPSLRSLEVIGADIKGSTWESRENHRTAHLQHLSLITYSGQPTRLINALLNPNLLSLSISYNYDRKNRSRNRKQSLQVPPLPKLQSLYLDNFSFPRDNAYLPVPFIPKSLKRISLDRCDLDSEILTRMLTRASQLEQFQMVMGYFSDDVDLRMLNNFPHLKSVDLFDFQVSAEVAQRLKARQVRVGGSEMFSW